MSKKTSDFIWLQKKKVLQDLVVWDLSVGFLRDVVFMLAGPTVCTAEGLALWGSTRGVKTFSTHRDQHSSSWQLEHWHVWPVQNCSAGFQRWSRAHLLRLPFLVLGSSTLSGLLTVRADLVMVLLSIGDTQQNSGSKTEGCSLFQACGTYFCVGLQNPS